MIGPIITGSSDGRCCPSASIVTTISALSCSAISYPTRRASPPPRRIGSSVTSAPASRARRAVASSLPSLTTTGITCRPSSSLGIPRTTSPTLSCSLNAGEITTMRLLSGRAAARSQSNRSRPSASINSRSPRSFVSEPVWSLNTRKSRSRTPITRTKITRRSAPGTMSNQLKTGSYTDGRSYRTMSAVPSRLATIMLRRLIRRRSYAWTAMRNRPIPAMIPRILTAVTGASSRVDRSPPILRKDVIDDHAILEPFDRREHRLDECLVQQVRSQTEIQQLRVCGVVVVLLGFDAWVVDRMDRHIHPDLRPRLLDQLGQLQHRVLLRELVEDPVLAGLGRVRDRELDAAKGVLDVEVPARLPAGS